MHTKIDTATPGSPLVEDIRVAMRKAFSFGQTYWQQADSESVSQNSKSDETATKFRQLVTDTCDALAAAVAHQATDTPVAPLAEAMKSARFVYGNEPMALQCLDYLQAVIDNPLPEFGPVAAPLPEAPAPTEGEKFRAHLQRASDKVATWPSWKRSAVAALPAEQAGELPPLPEWSKRDDLGGLVPSEIRTALKDYASAALAARQTPASTLTQSRDRALWTDEQRENHRKNKALIYRCTICCARKGELHLPSCSEQGICGVSTPGA